MQIFVNPSISHTILFERTRIVGRMLSRGPADIQPEQPVSRFLGGYAIYFSREASFAIERSEGWETHRNLVLLRPFERHRVLRCEGLRTILIEPESVCPRAMGDERWREGTWEYRDWARRIATGFDEWERMGQVPQRTVDQIVFGQELPRRKLDPRIAAIADRIANRPSERGLGVVLLAKEAGLSASRLSHLFQEQMGTSIRSFRAWKRVRQSMAVTARAPVLVNAAIDSGFADEPHYSRSMRKYFGQQAHVMQRHWRAAMAFRGAGPHPA